ncbi:Lrp/AsnC family transcriptional regulator [Streptomyces exfoliatus]|uniref:Lrp/AsnC family transcriptional regulator n=1 Tax=Streptomyces exfoliatus TaxID=1905 RepID=UPI0032444283
MQDSTQLDDLDRGLIEALQISPRASWTAVGAALRVDPVTARRRWDRLEREGLSWVTAYPVTDEDSAVALVTIGAEPARLDAVAAAIAEDPHVFTLERTTGGHSLSAIIMAWTLDELTGHCLARIEGTPGVRFVETHLATRFFTEGSRWRMRQLTSAQVSMLHEADPHPPTSRTGARRERTDEAVIAALAWNGRASGTELATVLGTTAQTARRRLDRVIASGEVIFRCDVAQSQTGWPVCATYQAAVRPGRILATAQALSTLPEIRMCVATTGAHNLHISVWLKSVTDSHRLETLLADRLPDLVLADRTVVLRQYKTGGRLVDPSGRALPRQ